MIQMFDFFTESDWIVLAILAILVLLYWLIFGTDAMRYLVA